VPDKMRMRLEERQSGYCLQDYVHGRGFVKGSVEKNVRDDIVGTPGPGEGDAGLGPARAADKKPRWPLSVTYNLQRGRGIHHSPKAVFGFDTNLVEYPKTACLTGCSHNSPFDGVSKADFDTC
jgi:hypothetical protein